MTTASDLRKSYEDIKQRIARFSAEAGRPEDSVELLAISKHHPASAIRALYETTGCINFGENSVDELCAKAAKLSDLNLNWHFTGRLQSRKVKLLMPYVSCIQSVESERHLKIISDHTTCSDLPPLPIYLGVNAANEPQKSGVAPINLGSLAERAEHFYPGVKLCGIMSIPPAAYSDRHYSDVPPLYRELKDLSKRVGEGKLSLGMTSDLRLAILAGATMVRIGTAIFGERPYG